MKKIRLTILVMLLFHFGSSQTLAEWFQQKKTQIQYLEEQIAALKAYAVVAQKGYAIAKSGLTLIGNIKKGDFTLHSYYFSSLTKVNLNVKAYTKIADIISMQIAIAKVSHQQRIYIQRSNEFSGNEIIYLGKVFDKLLLGCSEIIDHLLAVTTDGLLQMKDDERIQNVDKLYDQMQDRWLFVQDFRDANTRLAIQRMAEHNDVDLNRNLYGK